MQRRIAYQSSGTSAPDFTGHKSTTDLPHNPIPIALFAAALIVAMVFVWITRGPNTAYLPNFAPAPVILPDARALHVARFEVTIAEWNRCADDTACVLRLKPRPGFDAATTPATGISWHDAQEYITWVAARSRFPLRLPTAAEWQVMAAPVLPEAPDPIFTDPDLSWASAYLTAPAYARALQPQGSFSNTAEGISDLDGPVWEWTSDCYDPTLAPNDCAAFTAAGLHMSVISVFTRDPALGGCAVGAPPAHLGLRLVSDRGPPA